MDATPPQHTTGEPISSRAFDAASRSQPAVTAVQPAVEAAEVAAEQSPTVMIVPVELAVFCATVLEIVMPWRRM